MWKHGHVAATTCVESVLGRSWDESLIFFCFFRNFDNPIKNWREDTLCLICLRECPATVSRYCRKRGVITLVNPFCTRVTGLVIDMRHISAPRRNLIAKHIFGSRHLKHTKKRKGDKPAFELGDPQLKGKSGRRGTKVLVRSKGVGSLSIYFPSRSNLYVDSLPHILPTRAVRDANIDRTNMPYSRWYKRWTILNRP